MFMSVKLLKNHEIEDMPFELYTDKGRKLNYTTEYAYGNLYKIGNLVTFMIMWKGKISESNEYAFIRAEKLTKLLPIINPSVCVGEFTECLEGDPSTAYCQMAFDGLLSIKTGRGANTARWKPSNGNAQYLKLTGAYITG